MMLDNGTRIVSGRNRKGEPAPAAKYFPARRHGKTPPLRRLIPLSPNMSESSIMAISSSNSGNQNGQSTTSLANRFRQFASVASSYMGSSPAFILALALVVGWALAGPFYEYSDSWELVINTSTTIVTFLMVFLIQNTQNRDALAIQLKLDELLRALEGARTSLVNLESLSDEEMARLKEEFARLSGDKCEPLPDSAVQAEPA
jgi:low affinity Fe/Cu permease